MASERAVTTPVEAGQQGTNIDLLVEVCGYGFHQW